MIPHEVAKELHIVPEALVKEYAEHLESNGVELNNFTKLLAKAALFRHAGLTPIFLANKDASQFAVSSEETYCRKLH